MNGLANQDPITGHRSLLDGSHQLELLLLGRAEGIGSERPLDETEFMPHVVRGLEETAIDFLQLHLLDDGPHTGGLSGIGFEHGGTP